jgi:capsid protein
MSSSLLLSLERDLGLLRDSHATLQSAVLNLQNHILHLERIRTGIGMSTEAFSNDYTAASFSSVRQAILEERRGYRMQQQLLVRLLCKPTWELWNEWRVLFFGGVPAGVPVRFQLPGWQWVDPKKDAEAAVLRIRSGTASRAMLCEEQGLDFDDVAEALAEERKILIEHGLNPDPDAPAKDTGGDDADTQS